MATLWIREYVNRGSAGGREIQVPQEPGLDQSPISFTTSTQSAAFAATTKFIRVYGSAAFHYVVGDNPAATTNALKHPADMPLDIGVIAGQKIAVIAAS